MGGILGLKRNRSVARLAANLLGVNGAMTVDTNADGVVDGFTHAHSNEASVLSLDAGMPGQKVTLADVTAANAFVYIYEAAAHAVSPNTVCALSVDAALVRSGAETIKVRISWFTAGTVWISDSASAEINPGPAYSRQQVVVTSPATAALAITYFFVYAKTIGATGQAWFKDALFQAA
jgi:hypothetical protein